MKRRRVSILILALMTMLAAGGVFVGTAGAADGALDPSFSADGVTTSDPTALSEDPNGAVLDAQGREIVVFGGFAKEGPERAFVARYLPTGELDPTFGAGGLAEIPWTKETEAPNAVALDAQGRIVIGGDAVDGNVKGFDFAVARYLPDGTLDPTFGTGGLVTQDIPGDGFDLGNAVAVDGQGRVLVAGTAIKTVGAKSFSSMTVVRWTAGGTLDPTFGENGIAKVNAGSFTQAGGTAIAVDGAGRIDVAGSFGDEGGATPLVARLTENGRLDPAFGSGGLVPIGFGAGTSGALGALVLDGERIVVSGNFKTIGDEEGFGVARLLAAGTLDSTFGTAGTVATVNPATKLFARGLTIDAIGRIVIAGGMVEPLQTVGAMYRFTPAGALDPAFGNGGIQREDFMAAASFGNTPLIDSAGRYLLLGRASGGGNADVLAFARLLTSYSSPTTTPGGASTSTSVSKGTMQTPAPPRCGGRTATIVGTPGVDHLKGTKKADVIVGLGGNDTIKGLGGADLICAGSGADKVFGGAGADQIFGEGGADRLYGGAGADKLLGGVGNDLLAGGAGADHEVGGPGTDRQS